VRVVQGHVILNAHPSTGVSRLVIIRFRYTFRKGQKGVLKLQNGIEGRKWWERGQSTCSVWVLAGAFTK
jgi:hypothetical protein